MQISNVGIALIKKYEGCRLTAYKPVAAERYWTIGWGHYGPDVKAGSTITQAKADAMLVADLPSYAKHVNALNMQLTQNQFDALVSFCYNCGQGNLNRLCSDRSIASISRWITAYNKGSGQVLAGLVRRRAEEKALFDKPMSAKAKTPAEPSANKAKTTQYRITAEKLFIRSKPSMDANTLGTLKKGQTVQVVKIVDGWAHISSAGKTVYMGAKHLAKIK